MTFCEKGTKLNLKVAQWFRIETSVNILRKWRYSVISTPISIVCTYLLACYLNGKPLHIYLLTFIFIFLTLGRWQPPYEPHTAPWEWTGSVAILEKYMEGQGRPVKYGQCWVFSAVTTSSMYSIKPNEIFSCLFVRVDSFKKLFIDLLYCHFLSQTT